MKYILSIIIAFITLTSSTSQSKYVQALLPLNCSSARTKPVQYVMLHYTSNALANPTNPSDVKAVLQIFKKYRVSAHYLIDRDGTVYQLVNENRVAFHAGKGSLPDKPETLNSLNSMSIGIELMAVGTPEEMLKLGVKDYASIPDAAKGFTEQQYRSLSELLLDIASRHDKVKLTKGQIIGHDAYAPERRGDPGQLFDWERLPWSQTE